MRKQAAEDLAAREAEAADAAVRKQAQLEAAAAAAAAAELDRRRMVAAAELPAEPAAGTLDAITVQIKMPHGSTKRRR